MQQLQLNLTSAHQRHKGECVRYEDQITALEQELAGTRSRCQLLEQEVDRKEDQIKRNEAEVASCRDDIRNKVEDVSSLSACVSVCVLRFKKILISIS